MSQPLIALICDELGATQLSIARALNNTLHNAGFELLCVCGGPLKPHADRTMSSGAKARNDIYEAARTMDVAGYIVLTSIIGHHATRDEVSRFTSQFSHKPLVSFGIDIQGINSVSIDNYAAMMTLMNHMIHRESCKRYVFIRGFSNGPVSSERERAFRDGLQMHNIEVDENLILNGNFMAADSFFAMDALLQKTTNIDAVVAANDTMALNAIHALRMHGLSIPDDVIVSGFENTVAAEQSIPAITSIKEDLREQVDFAASSLLSQIPKNHLAAQYDHCESYKCSTKLIIRSSTDPEPMIASDAGNVLFDACSFSENMQHTMRNVQAPAGVLLNDIVEDIVGILVNGSRHSSDRLASALHLLRTSPADVDWWRHLHHQLGKNIQQQGPVGLAPDAVILTTSMMSAIQTTIDSVEASERVLTNRYIELVFKLRRQLSETATIEELEAVLRYNCELFRLHRAFICLYGKISKKPDSNSRLIFQHPAGTIDFPSNETFSSHKILPSDYLFSRVGHYLILEPLIIGSTHLGYMVVDERVGTFPGRTNFKALADSVSNALNGCI